MQVSNLFEATQRSRSTKLWASPVFQLHISEWNVRTSFQYRNLFLYLCFKDSVTTCLECAENTNFSEVNLAITWLRRIWFDLSWKDHAWSRLFERYGNSDRGMCCLRLDWISGRLPSEHLRHLWNWKADWHNQSTSPCLEPSWNVSEQSSMYTVWWNTSGTSFDPDT